MFSPLRVLETLVGPDNKCRDDIRWVKWRGRAPNAVIPGATRNPLALRQAMSEWVPATSAGTTMVVVAMGDAVIPGSIRNP